MLKICSVSYVKRDTPSKVPLITLEDLASRQQSAMVSVS